MESKKENCKYINKQYITLLSVLSSFSVVCLHTNGCFWNFSTESYWFTANIIEFVFYFAVPVFFMISGATLIDYQDRYGTREFFIRRLKKTVIPFIIWSFIGLAYRLVLKQILIEKLSLKFIINGILGTSIIEIYGFFISLFCIYLCIPLFASITKDNRKEIFSYLAVAGFMINFLIPFIKNVFVIDINWPLSISVVSGSLIYVIIGYLISNYEISKKNTIIIYILSIAGLIVHIIGTYNLSIKAGEIVMTFKGYNNVPCITYSVGIFLFFKNYGEKKLPFDKFIQFLGDYTFGIYLTHIYIMWMVNDYLFYNIFKINSTSIMYRLGAPFLIIFISILVVYVIRKVPVVKNIVP